MPASFCDEKSIATNGVIAGTQLDAFASTAVLLSLFSALEQVFEKLVITNHFPVSCSICAPIPHALLHTPPGTAAPSCLTSRSTSTTRGRHFCVAPAVIRLFSFRRFFWSTEAGADQLEDVG